jgi:glycine dehydrogenase
VAPKPRLSTTVSLKTPKRGLATAKAPSALSVSLDTFADRHIGPEDHELAYMLKQLGYDSIDAFVEATVPPHIRVASTSIDNKSIPAFSESQLFHRAKELAEANKPFRSFIGMGYHNAVVPPVILRNVSTRLELYLNICQHVCNRQIMESPAWYTPYTPYQPEIAQGNVITL